MEKAIFALYAIAHMKQYSTFIFDSYSFDPKTGKIALQYALDDEVTFTETITLPTKGLVEYNPEKLDRALQGLHLIGGISYYKTCCPQSIEVRTAQLTEDQAEFWNTVYENGLGEFFYKNDIAFNDLIHFPVHTKDHDPIEQSSSVKAHKTLVPIGGGKDSLVTIELLKKNNVEMTLLRMGKHPLIDACIKKTGASVITVERELSPTLFELNEAGALNGHIPITAYLSFVCIVISELFGFDDIAMSNESSANEGNVEFHGKVINHQWSKGEEFAKLFRAYIETYIDPSITYESHLHEMNELQVVQEFVQYPQYFDCVTSCNSNWRIAGDSKGNRWCGLCPKCAFSFALFAAFLPKKVVLKIFGSDLFESSALLPLYRQLLGIEGFKPFECVGTAEETTRAFSMIHAEGEFEDSPIMNMFLQHFPQD